MINFEMYWRPNVDSSKFDSLLNNENITLKEVLSEDGVINEVQVYNEKLLNYLVTPNHISEMLNILISTPQPNEDGVLFFGEQNIVSEILSSYVNIIYSTLSSNPDYLGILFKPFVRSDSISSDELIEPINSVTCSLLFKVAKVLCQQSSDKLFNFLVSTDGILDQFVNNIECNSVSEFLIKCIQSFQPTDVLVNYLKWLSREDITSKLLSKIQLNSETQVCIKSIQCLAELLSAIKSTKVENPLLSDLQNSRVVTHILSVMLDASASKMSMIGCGLDFIKSIFEIPEKQTISSFTNPIYQTFRKTSINSQEILENPNLYNPIIDCLVLKLSDFKIILEDTSELSKIRIPTAYGGEIVGPLGPHRLALIDLIHHLVLLEQNRIYYEIIHCEIITTLLNLFFEFHLNTFLHRFVTEIINKLIVYASESLNSSDHSNSSNNIAEKILHEVIVNQDLLNKIMVTWSKNMTPVNGTDKMIRNTHRPFLKEIANTIEKEIFNFVRIVDQNTLKVWKVFTDTKLADENKRNTIKKKNMMSYPDSSSEGEGAIETIEDIDSEDTLKIYEDCTQQEMIYPFPDYSYKPIFVPEKSSMESELNSNPLTDFFLSTQEDIENAENFESVCNVMLTTKMPCDNAVEQNECLVSEMDYTLTSEVENIEDIYENNFNKSSGIQTNVIDSVFREAYKDLNQPSKHEIKILDSRSPNSRQIEVPNNRFQFRTSTGLPALHKQRNFWNSNSIKIEKIGDNIVVGSTLVPRLKFGGDTDEKSETSKSLFVSTVISRAVSDDKETQPGSPFSIDEEDEVEEESPLCSTARYIPNEKSSDFSDESDDEYIPLSSRLEKEQFKPSENLSQLDNRLDDKTWNNPSNNQAVDADDVELEFDTVQNVTPDLVITHCNTFPSGNAANFSDKDESQKSISVPVNICIRPANESDVQSDEAGFVSPSANIEFYEIENPFSPKLIRHSIHSSAKEAGSFQKVNRSISAPIKLNVNNDTTAMGFHHHPESIKAQSLFNGLDESNIPNSNPLG